MSVESQDYKSEVLEYAVNDCINRLLPSSSEDALSVILYQTNEVVWRVATEIYTKSGYQVDFLFIRSTLILRIEPLQETIAEEARIKAELEAQRLAKIAEEKRIRKEKEIEKARLEAERLEKIAKQKQLDKERKAKEKEKLQAFRQENPNIERTYENFDTFVRIRNVIIDFFQVDRAKIIQLEKIKFYTFIMKDLGADELDNIEIVMAIEEEFDIEIFDEDLPSCSSNFQYSSSSGDWNLERMFYLVVQKIN